MISTIVVTAEAFLIPFELMYDGKSFLATKVQFYRNAILEKVERPKLSSSIEDHPYHIAFITNPTDDLPQAQVEANRIINFFEKIKKDFNLRINNLSKEMASYKSLSNIFLTILWGI